MCLLWTEERRSLGCFCLFAVLHTAVVYFIFRLFFVCSFRFVFIIAADVCDCEHVSVRMCSSTRMPCTRDPYILYHVCAFRLFYIPVALYIFFFLFLRLFLRTICCAAFSSLLLFDRHLPAILLILHCAVCACTRGLIAAFVCWLNVRVWYACMHACVCVLHAFVVCLMSLVHECL